MGEILEDGSVVDEDGNVIGRRMPDGLVIDDDGTLVGIEEIKKPDTSGMFVPPVLSVPEALMAQVPALPETWAPEAVMAPENAMIRLVVPL
ncbi:MAG: hypothetical protein ACLU99_02075 [Alphaproteobacteria bacterium]